jgi:glyceraldehyde 3-phosphate dehydrogenase
MLGDPEIEFVGISDLTDTKTLAHLLKYDSILGNLDIEIGHTENSIIVAGKEIASSRRRIRHSFRGRGWRRDCRQSRPDRFTDKDRAEAPRAGSVKKVIISAPAKNEDITIVLGVNE